MPRAAPATTAVRPNRGGRFTVAPPSAEPPGALHQAHELVTGALLAAEDPAQRRSDGLRVLLLHAPHHHAEVERLDHHPHAVRLEGLLERVGDLVGEALLHLQAP